MIALLVIAIPDGGRYSVVLNGGYNETHLIWGKKSPFSMRNLIYFAHAMTYVLALSSSALRLNLTWVYLCNLL